MESNVDYSLVLINLIEELDKDKYNNNSLPLKRIVSSSYSTTIPSVQVQASDAAPLIIYDIEVGTEISKIMTEKWRQHSAICSFIYLIVREEISKKVDEVCAKELSNHMVIPFKFKKIGNNRKVVIKFP